MTGWPSKPLKDVCKISPSKKEAKSLPETMPVSFMPMEDLGIGFKYSTPVHERPIGELIGSYTYFRENEVLLAKITPCFENGKLGIAKGLTNGVGFGSSEYIVFRPSDDINSEYLYYFLARSSFRQLGANHMSGAVGHKRVAKEFIENTQIPLPPLAIQKAIVAKLDAAFASIDTAIAAAEKNAENAKQLFQSSLTGAFVSEGNLTKFDQCIEKVKYTTKVQRSQYLEVGSFPIVSQEAVDISGYWNNSADVFKVSSPVIVFGDHTRVLKYINFDFVLGADGVKIIKPKENIDAKWFYYCLMAFPMATKGYARHFRFFSDLGIHIPAQHVQRAVIVRLDALDDQTKVLLKICADKIACLTELKQSLLQQAFSGQLVDA